MPESISSSILPAIIQRLSEQHPRVVPDVDAGPTDTMIKELLDRSLDLVVARGRQTLADDSIIDRLKMEVLFQDKVVVAAGAQSKWARRRKIELAELVDERWIMSAPGTWNHMVMAEAFRGRGLDMPRTGLTTLSVSLRTILVATSPSIGVFPDSVLRVYGDRFSLKRLPVDLPVRPWPVTIVTLKNRTLVRWLNALSNARARSQNPLPARHAKDHEPCGPLPKAVPKNQSRGQSARSSATFLVKSVCCALIRPRADCIGRKAFAGCSGGAANLISPRDRLTAWDCSPLVVRWNWLLEHGEPFGILGVVVANRSGDHSPSLEA